MAAAGKTFRVFVSSTFSDLKAERDALQQRVFPSLRELCMSHGCRFQSIDLRWGISEEASISQETVSICLEELARCQRLSPRPNFIVLLGDRYGWRPLPHVIHSHEFRRIATLLEGSEEGKLLETWYLRDDNAVYSHKGTKTIGTYILQPRTGPFEDYATWEKDVEIPLRAALMDTVRDMNLPPEERLKYEASATHQEIYYGALSVPDSEKHVFCYFRQIDGLPTDATAWIYRDLRHDGSLDADASNRLDGLKAQLKNRLPKSHINERRASWPFHPSQDDLETLCKRVESDLKRVIEEEISGTEGITSLRREVEDHVAFGKERAHHFSGRHDILSRIREYLVSIGSEPLVIHGPSGSGKTALLAMAAALARDESRRRVEGGPSIVIRFIGATPESTQTRSLLESICSEIAEIYGDRRPIPSEYRDLIEDLPRRLSLADERRPLNLFLDALDNLDPSDNAHTLNWLPTELPLHAKIVATVMDDDKTFPERHDRCFRSAQQIIQGKSMIPLCELSLPEVTEILERRLAHAGRTLQPHQRREVIEKSSANGLPLYLKLALDEASRWRSYTNPSLTVLPVDLPGLVDATLDRLARPQRHGGMLVSRALGYLASARNGLSEDELLDILAEDEEYFAHVLSTAHHDLPVEVVHGSLGSQRERRLPVVLWSRLLHDIDLFLSLRRADGASLLTFYHRHLSSAVTRKYLAGERRSQVHQNLARYFWSQPHSLNDRDEGLVPNYRKASELPYHLFECEQWQDLAELLTDFDFVRSKIHSEQVFDLMEHLNQSKDAILSGGVDPGLAEEFTHWKSFISTSVYKLARLDESFLQLSYNHSGSSLVSLEAEYRALSREAPWIRLLNRPTKSPLSSSTRVMEGHSGRVNALALAPNGKWAVSGDSDGLIRIWDLSTGESLNSLEGHSSPVRSVWITAPDGARIVSSDDLSVRLWDGESGACLRVVEISPDWAFALAVTPDGRHAITGSNDSTLRSWDLETGQCLRTIKGPGGQSIKLAISPDGKLAALSTSRDGSCLLTLWNLRNGALLRRLHDDVMEYFPLSVVDEGRQLVCSSGDWRISLWDLRSGERKKEIDGDTGSMSEVTVTPDQKHALSWDRWSGIIRLWSLSTGDCLKTLPEPDSSVSCLAATADNDILIAASGSVVKVWSITDDDGEGTAPETTTGPVASVTVTPDGRHSISAGPGRVLRGWDVEGGKCLWTMMTAAFGTLAVTSDGEWVLCGGERGTLEIWDVASGGRMWQLHGHTDVLEGHIMHVMDVAVAPDGRWAVSASGWRDPLFLWDLKRWQCAGKLHGHTEMVLRVAITPDGQRVLSGGSDCNVMVWDPFRGQLIHRLEGHTASITSLFLTSDGRRALSASRDGTVRHWDIVDGRCLRPLEGHCHEVSHVIGTPDGRRAISAAGQWRVRGEIKVWDLETGDCIKTLAGHTDSIKCLAVTPDGLRAISGALDHTVRVWDLTKGREICTFETDEAVHSGAMSPDGKTFVAGDGGGRVYMLHFENMLNDDTEKTR